MSKLDLDLIRSRITIPSLLDRFGIKYRHHRCCCPVHQGDNPQAFSFTDDVFFCHTNGCKGNIFDLYMALSRKDFRESALDLANIAGVSTMEYRPTAAVANMRLMVESPERKLAREHKEDLYFLQLQIDSLVLCHKIISKRIGLDPSADLFTQFHSIDADLDELDKRIQTLRWNYLVQDGK